MSPSDTALWKDRLRQARIEHNWRQHEVAERVGASVLTVQRWERGSHQPSVYFQLKLCALFGKNAEELGFVPDHVVPPSAEETLFRPGGETGQLLSDSREKREEAHSFPVSSSPDERTESPVQRPFPLPKQVHPSRRKVLTAGIALGGGLACAGIWKVFASLNQRQRIPTIPPLADGRPFRYTHAGAVTFLSWSPDGKWLASASADQTVQIYDLSTGSQVRTYRGHTDTVSGVAFSPDGTHLVSTSLDGTVQLWEATTGTKKGVRSEQSMGVTGPLSGASWSSEIACIACIANDVAVVLDANTLAFRNGSSNVVSVPNAVSLAPHAPVILFAAIDHLVRTWDLTTQIGFVTCAGHTRKVLAVGWSPDGTKAVSGGQDQTVRIWEVPTVTEGQVLAGTSVLVYGGHTDWVQAVVWSPDGSKIASAGRDQTVQVWDASSGHVLFSHRGHKASVNSLAWSPDGAFLASASDDTSVQIWKVT